MTSQSAALTREIESNATQQRLTGMTGVYLAAAEPSHRGFISSPTCHGARGTGILVTHQGCRRAWSVQVKTDVKKRRRSSLREGDAMFKHKDMRGNNCFK